MTQKLLKQYVDQSSAYETISPNGRLHIVCPQCGAVVLLFEDLSLETKRKIAELEHNTLRGGMEGLMEATGCDFGQAKASTFHLRDALSRCHNCESQIPRGALLCAQCMAVNLDW